MTNDLTHYREALSPKLLAYVDRLEAAIGDDRTFAIIEEIKRDKSIKRADAIAMARAAIGIRARSKTDAIELLCSRHRWVMSSRARSRAIGGRIAA